MQTLIEAVAPAGNSAPNTEPKASLPAADKARMKEFRGEIHKPEAEFNANVPVDEIEPDPQNRDKINPEAIAGLAESIKADGLLQPVVLRLLKPGHYRLIAGERRWRAHKLLKRPTIAARIYRSEDDLSAARKKVVENHQRENLTPIEEARRMKELAELGMKQADIGKLLGKSQPVVANMQRLLELPAKVQQFLAAGELTAAHGVSLARFVRWPAVCEAMGQIAINEEFSSKELNREEVPFAYKLQHSGKLVEIETGKSEYWLRYKIPEELQKDPDFLKLSDSKWICFAPSKWKPHHERQKADWEKQQAQKRSGGRAAGGKMTDGQKKERAGVIAKNKAARGAVDASLKNAIARLRDTKDLDLASLVVVCERAWNDDFSEAATALGIKLPQKGFPGLEDLRGLGAPMLVKLCAVEIMLEESEQARRFAGAVPDSVEFIAGKFKASGAVSKDGTIEVSVATSGGDNRARAGSATASCTSGAPDAARAAAAKHFGCKPEQIQLQSNGHGSYRAKRVQATPPAPKAANKHKPAKRTVIDDAIRSEVRKLHEAGRTGTEIAKICVISLPSVHNIKKALGFVRPK